MNQLTTPRDTTSKATEQQISQALLLLTSLPYRAADKGDARHEAYQVALKGVTRYSLGEATTNILQGMLGHAFFPSPPEFRTECNRVAARIEIPQRRAANVRRQLSERKRIERVYAQKTPAAKARVQKMVDDFHAQIPQPEPEAGFNWSRVQARFDNE